MQIETGDDFVKLSEQFKDWRNRFPMFAHDIRRIEDMIYNHIRNHSIALMHYRQTHKQYYLDKAQEEIDEINRILLTVEQIEIIAILSSR